MKYLFFEVDQQFDYSTNYKRFYAITQMEIKFWNMCQILPNNDQFIFNHLSFKNFFIGFIEGSILRMNSKIISWH